MTSERAIHANRSNSKKSTGPRTPAGKARSQQNARKHGFSIVDANLKTKAETEHLAGLIVGIHGNDLTIMEAARTAAAAQIYLHQVQVFKTSIFRHGAAKSASKAGVGQNLQNDCLPEKLIEVERLGRYESQALFRRNLAFRRLLELINQAHRF